MANVAQRRVWSGPLHGLWLAAAMAALPGRVYADSVELSLRVDRTRIALSETFTLEVKLTTSGVSPPRLSLPDLSEFDVLARQVQNPVSFRLGFGAQTQVVTAQTLHRLTLRPRRAGTFRIGPATVSVSGGQQRSNTVQVEVVGSNGAGGASAAPSPDPAAPGSAQAEQLAPPPIPPDGELDGAVYDNEAFLRTLVEPADPVVGQPVTVSVLLYLGRRLGASPTITQEATTDGFWVQDLLPPRRRLQGRTQEVFGRRFQVFVLRRFAAFPLRAGTLTIGAPAVRMSRGGLIDQFFGGGVNAPLERRGVPVAVEVRELPSPRPDGAVFVGDLSLVAELDPAEVPAGEPATLTLRASGRGQVSSLNFDRFSIPNARVLQPEVDEQVDASSGVVRGTKTYRWLLIPSRPGELRIPPFEVATFLPAERRYGRAHTEALSLRVTGSAAADADPPAPDVKADSTERDAAFGPIRTRSSLKRDRARPGEHPYWLMGLGPLLLGLALGAEALRARRSRQDPRALSKRAKAEAIRHLRQAEAHLGTGDHQAFYTSARAAVAGLVEAKLGRSVSGLTYRSVENALRAGGAEAQLAKSVVQELEGFDFARFSAVGVSPDEMASCLVRIRSLVQALHKVAPARTREAA